MINPTRASGLCHASVQLPRLPGEDDHPRRNPRPIWARTSSIERLSETQGGRYFKYRPSLVNTVRTWSWRGRRRGSPESLRAAGIGCLSLLPLRSVSVREHSCVGGDQTLTVTGRDAAGYGCILWCASRSRSLALGAPT
jgi:hypothetical protein